MKTLILSGLAFACLLVTFPTFSQTAICPEPGRSTEVFLCVGTPFLNLTNPDYGERDPEGTWIDPNSNPIPDPSAVDISELEAGTYAFAYRISSEGNCPGGVSILRLTLEPPFNPGTGTSGIGLQLRPCLDGLIDLNFLLGPEATPGGQFELSFLTRKNSDPIPIPDGLLDPDLLLNEPDFKSGSTILVATYFRDMGCRTERRPSAAYRFKTRGGLPPGEDNAVTLCQGNTIDLVASLAGSPAPNGVWSGPAGVDLGDPTQVDLSMLGPGDYAFEYTVSDPPPCQGRQVSRVIVNLGQPGDAGEDGAVKACRNLDDPANTVNLFSALKGTPESGGDWIVESGPPLGPESIDLSDPEKVALNNRPIGTYVFKYKIEGSGTCPADSARVTVSLENSPFAGIDATESVCTGGELILNIQNLMLITQLGNFIDSTNSIDFATDLKMVDFSGLDQGEYAFFHILSDPDQVCRTDTAELLIKANLPSFPGFSSDTVLCVSDTSLDLNTLLYGDPDPGGTWASLDTPAVPVDAGGIADLKGLSPGDYSFSRGFEASGNCPAVATSITVTLAAEPERGQTGFIELCQDEPDLSVNLFTAIGLDPGAGGNGFPARTLSILPM